MTVLILLVSEKIIHHIPQCHILPLHTVDDMPRFARERLLHHGRALSAPSAQARYSWYSCKYWVKAKGEHRSARSSRRLLYLVGYRNNSQTFLRRTESRERVRQPGPGAATRVSSSRCLEPRHYGARISEAFRATFAPAAARSVVGGDVGIATAPANAGAFRPACCGAHALDCGC